MTASEASRLAPAWRNHLSGPVDGSAIVVDGHVVIGSEGGDLVSVLAGSGGVEWRKSGVGAIAGSVAVDAGDVFVATLSGHLREYSFADGGLRWDWKPPGLEPALWSSPIVVEDKVLIGIASQAGDQPLEAGRLIAVSRAHGKQVWELCSRPACAAGGGIWSTPAIDARGRGFVGVGNPEDGVLAFDAATGRRLWQTGFNADESQDLDVGATPAVFDLGSREVVAVGSDGGIFNLLDASTGDVLWSRSLVAGSAVHGLIASPAFDGSNLYAPSASGPTGVFALKAADGSVQWSFPTKLPIYSAPAIGRQVLVFGEGNVFGDTGTGSVSALDVKTHRLLWTYATHSAVRSGPVIAGDMVVVGDYSGDVMAFRPNR